MKRQQKTLGAALIGAGNFSRRQHLPNLHRIPEAQLVAVCDVDDDVANKQAAKYHALYAETDYRRVLSDDRIDAVVIAVRDDSQARISREALQAGKHVYVEKPLSPNADECKTVADAMESSGKRLAVGYNKRFAPVYQLAKKVMSADGGPKNIHLRMADDAWRWAVGYPAGHLLSLDVCHFFDLLRWFTGAEVSTVYAISSRPEDYCIAVQMTDASVASIFFSGNGTMDMPKERVDAVCTRGGITAIDYVELRTYGYAGFDHIYRFSGHSHPDGEFAHVYLTDRLGAEALSAIRRGTWEIREQLHPVSFGDSPYAAEAQVYADKTIPNFLRDQGWLQSLRAFFVGLSSGVETDHATAEDALVAARATEAALRSLQHGKPVTLPE